MLAEEPVEERQVSGRDAASPGVDGFGVLERQNGQALAHRRVRDGEVAARVEIALTALRIALDHPTDAQAAQTQRLREIPKYSGVREPGGGAHLRTMVDGMVDLVGDELDAAFCAEVMQRFHFTLAQHGTGGIVRRVYEQEAGVAVDEAAYLVEIDAESVFGPQMVVTNLEADGFRHGRVGGKPRIGQHDVGARFGREEEQDEKGFGGARDNLDLGGIYALERGNRFPELDRSAGAGVD